MMRYLFGGHARSWLLIGLLASLSACSKPIDFTDYTIENLLKKNIEGLAEPAFFELREISILSKQDEGERGSAEVYIYLYFADDLASVAEKRQLSPDKMEYRQYESSFGNFAAGETQRHHAEYQFFRRDGKWYISGSRALSAPVIQPSR